MSEKEPTQRTPKGEEIPIPRRVEFMEALEKVAKPDEDDEDSGDSGPEEQEPEGR